MRVILLLRNKRVGGHTLGFTIGLARGLSGLSLMESCAPEPRLLSLLKFWPLDAPNDDRTMAAARVGGVVWSKVQVAFAPVHNTATDLLQKYCNSISYIYDLFLFSTNFSTTGTVAPQSQC